MKSEAFLVVTALACLSSTSPSLAEIADNPAIAARMQQQLDPAGIDANTDEALASDLNFMSYYVVAMPVQELLERVVSHEDVRLVRSDAVTGIVVDIHASGTFHEVLDAICADAGLDWFSFNGSIYVSGRNEAATRLIRLGDLSWERAIESLVDAGLPLDRFQVRPTSESNILTISGPPELLAIAETVIESIPVTSSVRTPLQSPRTVLVRRGTEVRTVILRAD